MNTTQVWSLNRAVFGGREFRFRSAEVGHVHTGGIVDIPFPRSVRDALLADGLEEHHWVPNSGWITFRIRSEDDLKHAVWLMHLSYLRYALKTATDPRGLLESESEEVDELCSTYSVLEVWLMKPLPSCLGGAVLSSRPMNRPERNSCRGNYPPGALPGQLPQPRIQPTKK